MNKHFCELNEIELQQVDGGFGWAAVWTGVKVVAAVAGVGAAGVVVGAGVVIGTYYACKGIFG